MNPLNDLDSPWILVCVEKPKTADDRKDKDWPKWHALLEDSKELLSELKVKHENPVENVWLLPVHENLKPASRFLCLCADSGLDYTVFHLAKHPISG